MLSFDTNVLVYAADRQAGDRHEKSAKLLSAAISRDVALNDQSLVEFTHVMTRKQKLSLSDAALMVRAWLNNFALITAPGTIIEDTFSLLSSYRLSTWDAHMIAICDAHGCDFLLSEDLTDGALYSGVRVLNPFNPHNTSTIGNLLLP
jgi:predicted nucleic acid-binding protein